MSESRKIAVGGNVPHAELMALLDAALKQREEKPLPAVHCDHDWPEKDGQTDMEGCCMKCGRSFIAYIHMDMP